MTLHLSPDGHRLLRLWEGVKPHRYRDSAGYLSIGIGHRLTRDELSSGKIRLLPNIIKWRCGLADDQMERLMQQDLVPMCRAVEQVIAQGMPDAPLLPHQTDALILLTYNIGPAAFAGSTLAQRLIEGDRAAVVTEWRRWIHSGGKIDPGLRARREREIALWEGRSA